METTEKSFIGPSLVIKGRVVARNQSLNVQGRIEGDLDVDDILVVEEQGVIDASLVCREVHIAGQVTANIYATEKAVIGPNGRVSGALFAPVFSVSEGARLQGSVEMDNDNSSLEKKFHAAVEKSKSVGKAKPARKTPKKATPQTEVTVEGDAPAAQTTSTEKEG